MNMEKPPQATSLFELLARRWSLGAPVRQVLANAAGTAVVALLEDGQLAFLRMEDAESPEKRLRMELDSGRMTIRPREQPLPAPLLSEGPVAAPGLPVVCCGEQGFAFVHARGSEVWHATARGQLLRKATLNGVAITALAARPQAQQLVVAQEGGQVTLLNEEWGEVIATSTLAHPVARLAISADGARIACWGPGQVTILRGDLTAQVQVAVEGSALTLAFSPDGRWLAGGCAEKALFLVDLAAAKADRIVDFPDAVKTAAFCAASNALIASGAYRVVGWQGPDLPFGEHGGTALSTGRPGLIPVEVLAPQPGRALCAVGYANGLVVLGRIGERDELMLAEGQGKPVTALAWTQDGAHLAIGGADGSVAIATFPKSMFK